MRNIFYILLLGMSSFASATTYYVSSSGGNDANSGTSTSSPWQTMAKVNASTFSAGDSVLLKRGDVWNESLVPPSSGSSGNPIAFDAYGSGAAPTLTGYYAIPASGWTLVTGNAWKANVPSTFTSVNFCLFGSVWGQKVSPSTSNLLIPGDFFLVSGTLRVYSAGNPATFYHAPIVPMALSNTPVLNVNSKTWLTFQHILINWFDQFGVQVQGTSDHLVFANMEADSMIPQGTQPLGFFVNETTPGPADIKIYNSEAHMNYDGFRFDGVASGISMVNDKAYGNRDGALVDNTGAVNYSYCHFYASSLAVAGSTDVEFTTGSGPTAGLGNIPADTDSAVQVYQRYPARVSLTVDDAGMTPGADAYYGSTVLPIADAAGASVGVAITVGYQLAQTLVSEFQGWVNAGRDVTSHSISHTYYTNTDALDIQYTGAGSAAALSISGNTFTITVTGAADSVSYNLARGQPRGTIQGLRQALVATGKFTATEALPCQGPYGTGCSAFTEEALLSQDLADVSGVNVKSAVYAIQLDVTRLTMDELTLSRSWMTSHLTGLPATPVYVYPGGFETIAMQGIAAGVPYAGARGALKEDLGVKDTYASGFNVQDITSFGVNPSWQGLAPSVLNQKIQALVWKQKLWGVPWGIFFHINELTPTEITNLIQDFQTNGATIQTNTDLVNFLLSGSQHAGADGNSYYKSAALSMALDLRPTGKSPVVDAGQNLGAAYQIDINGVNQSSYGNGWEIGAHAFIPYASYGRAHLPGSSYSSVGRVETSGVAQLPQSWVDDLEVNPPGGTYDVAAVADGGSGAGHYANNFGGLQQAICDWVAAPDQWWLVKVPHGTVIDTTSTGYTCTQSGSTTVKALTLMTKIVGGAMPTKFLVFDSDQPLPRNRTVCSGGTADWISTRQPPSGSISTWWSGGNSGCADDIGSMWTLEGNWNSGNLGNAIQAGPWDSITNIGPSHYAFRNVELRPIVSYTTPTFVVNVDVGAGGATPTLTSQLGSHIHFAGVYGHGDATDWNGTAGGPTNNHISTFMKMSSCQFCSVTYSYFDYITSQNSESQVIGASSTPGPLKIAHNWMSGASIAMLLGGVASTNANYYANDIEVRENRLTNPPSWVGSGYSGPPLVIKSRQEFKTCRRCLVDGNIAEYVDTSGAQQGQCFTLTPRSCSAGLQCDNYQVAIQDVTFSNNVCRHALTGFTMAGRSGYPSNGGGAAAPARRWNVSNNLFYDLGNGPLYDAAATIPFPYAMRPTIGGQNFICSGTNASGTITLTCGGGPAGLLQTQISPGDLVVVTNCSDATWNFPTSFTTQRGAVALNGTAPGGLTVVYANSAAVASTATGCVVGNLEGLPANLNFVHNTIVMQTTAGGRNNGRIYSGNTGTVYTDSGCSGAGPVNATAITSLVRAAGIVTAGVASTSGWGASLASAPSQTIVEVSGSGGFNGTFYYLGQSGGNLQWMQAGANETGSAGGTAQQMGTCPTNQFLQNNTWKNNLVAVDVGSAPSCPGTPSSGWTGWSAQGDGNVEGCPSGAGATGCSENEVDITNSVVTNTDFPGRCATKYMEVGGPHPGLQPPASLTFPAGTVCSGTTADANCVGMLGMMNGAAFDPNDADYHNYGLHASSTYTVAADDGAALGADIRAIDNAIVGAKYLCTTGCGVGPVADPPKIQILAPGGGVSMPDVNTVLKPNPLISGIIYPLWWSCSDQDGTSAHYTWTNFDNQIASDGWPAAGKKVNIVLGGVTYGGADAGVCAGGSGFGTSGLGNFGTPAYVWAALSPANYANCTFGGITQRIPNYLNSAYKSNYQNWIAATLAHLAASPYASSIGYIRIAWGKGGETTPIANWDATGMCPDGSGNNTLTTDWAYTISGWESFLNSGMTFEAGLNSHLQLMISITPMGPSGGSQNVVPDSTAPVAASLHIGFGSQGLNAGDVADCPGATGDWCELFQTYQGQVPLELQTLLNSCATSNMNGSCATLSNITGPLDPLLIWGAQNHATTIELYWGDALAMLDPGFSQEGYAEYPQPDYLAALWNVVGGNY